MDVRDRHAGLHAPGGTRWLAALCGAWLPALLAMAMVGAGALPLSAQAAPASGSEATSATNTSPKRLLLPLEIWERLRESTHRLVEPDARILRYTARYAISPELAKKITETAVAEGIDPDLAFRLVWVESRFYPRARGPGGSLGLTQLMPSTARAVDRSLKTEADILEPRTNLHVGFRYLRSMIERYDDVRLGLLAYNRGPVSVDRALRRGQDPENGYSRKVLQARGSRYQGKGLLSKCEPRDSSAQAAPAAQGYCQPRREPARQLAAD